MYSQRKENTAISKQTKYTRTKTDLDKLRNLLKDQKWSAICTLRDANAATERFVIKFLAILQQATTEKTFKIKFIKKN